MRITRQFLFCLVDMMTISLTRIDYLHTGNKPLETTGYPRTNNQQMTLIFTVTVYVCVLAECARAEPAQQSRQKQPDTPRHT